MSTELWLGNNPYFLVIEPDEHERGNLGIDLDTPGWATLHADWLRLSGWWYLAAKGNGAPVLTLRIHAGDQPYYTARHVGIAGSGGSNEIVAFGIGAKRADGQVERLWILPNGTVCGGDDVDELGVGLLHLMGPRRDHDNGNGAA